MQHHFDTCNSAEFGLTLVSSSLIPVKNESIC